MVSNDASLQDDVLLDRPVQQSSKLNNSSSHVSAGNLRLPSLIDATASELLSGLRGGRFTSVDLVNVYIARINEVNAALRAVLELNPDVSSIAAQLDAERAQGQLRSPLHGLPVLIKGNIGTRDRMQTNAGSYALQHALLPSDSTVVAKLRQRGLIILGKSSLSEWSLFRSDNESRAWNAISGQSYGAYCLNQCPGASSSGSAIATDLGLAWATIGTETSGSIISPSERNNVVGIKPTVGLTSRYLVVPVSERQDTIGPITRTVSDAAHLLQAIAGPDSKDSYTAASPFKGRHPNYAAACKLSGLRGKRIGVARNVIRASMHEVAHVMPEFEKAIAVMVKAGAEIVEDANFTAFEEWKQFDHNPITRADFACNIAQYLSALEVNPRGIHTIEDLRAFTRSHPDEDYPRRNTRNWDTAIEGKLTNTSREFNKMYKKNLEIGGEGGINGALERHRLDAVILPSSIAFTIPALVGTPIITVPLGVTADDVPVVKQRDSDVVEVGPGIPFGVSFLGAKWSEETLIEMAYAFEQQTQVRRTLSRVVSPSMELDDVVGEPRATL